MQLVIDDIYYAFNTGKPLLDHISLSVDSGQIYLLAGGNGSGKTTLLNIICGYIRPLRGAILLDQKSIVGHAPNKISLRGIGRTFQIPRLAGRLSIRENIILAMKENPSDSIFFAILPKRFYAKSSNRLLEKANEIMANFFLSDIADLPASQISFGQQKLLALACCEAGDSQVWLLDEPIAGVQPEYCQIIVSLLKQLKEKGKSILIVEHNLDFFKNVTDKIFFLHNGLVSVFSDMGSFVNSPTVSTVYLNAAD